MQKLFCRRYLRPTMRESGKLILCAIVCAYRHLLLHCILLASIVSGPQRVPPVQFSLLLFKNVYT